MEKQFATTLPYHLAGSVWEARARVLEMPYEPPAHHSNADELAYLRRLLAAARGQEALLLNCSSGRFYPDLLAAAVMGFWRKRPRIALMGAMWEPNSGLRGLIERLVVRLAGRAIDLYATWSQEEAQLFASNWHIPPDRVRACQYFYTVPDAPSAPVGAHEAYVFAGGNTQRDYEPLIEAARRLPDRRFVLATHRLDGRTDLPANLVARQVPQAEYNRLLGGADAVVIPMQRNLRRGAGHQTYLNAMMLGKPTIVNRVPGVAEYIEDGVSALIVSGEADSYVEAIRRISAPETAAAIGAAGRRVAMRYSYEAHLDSLLAVMDELQGQRQPAATAQPDAPDGARGRT